MTQTAPPPARDPKNARYGGLETLAAGVPAGLDALFAHRSVRAYLPDPVPPADLQTAIAAAQSAPSSSNLQLWSAVAVTDPARKSCLSVLAGDQAHIHAAPLLLVWLADLARIEAVARLESLPAEGLDYLELFLTAAIDAALAAQNAQIALEAMGYGACYIGSIRSHPDRVAAELGLPPRVFPVFGMTVGREDPARRTGIKPRLPQRAVLWAERYGPADLPADVAAYNRAMQGYQDGQGMDRLDWSLKSARRVASPAALKNRDKLRLHLNRMGFPLK